MGRDPNNWTGRERIKIIELGGIGPKQIGRDQKLSDGLKNYRTGPKQFGRDGTGRSFIRTGRDGTTKFLMGRDGTGRALRRTGRDGTKKIFMGRDGTGRIFKRTGRDQKGIRFDFPVKGTLCGT